MKKITKTKRLLVVLLALVFCLSFNTTVFSSNNTNVIETEKSIARAGGGSAVRYVTSETTFTFPVSGSGMSKIKVETSGTTSNNNIAVTVIPSNGNLKNFFMVGNQITTKHDYTLTAGTYTVTASVANAPAVVAVYIE